jgi:uncharacterized protein YggT (Ycf19 family)
VEIGTGLRSPRNPFPIAASEGLKERKSMQSLLEPIYVDYWFYFSIDWILAALMWTCFGRFVLGALVGGSSENYIWRFFCRITDPVQRLLSPMTPGFLHPAFVPLAAAFWLIVLRVAYWLMLYNLGLAPRLEDYGIAPGG